MAAETNATTAQAACCTRCGAPVPPELLNRDRPLPCPACQAQLMVAAYPALLTGPAAAERPRELADEDEASCFYHPGKQAVVHCDACGRFLCALCDIQLGGRHLCPNCLKPAAGTAPEGAPTAASELDRRRVLYDRMALMYAILPLGFTPLITLYLAVRYWSAPGGLLRGSKVRWIAAVLIALAQLFLWYALIFSDWF